MNDWVLPAVVFSIIAFILLWAAIRSTRPIVKPRESMVLSWLCVFLGWIAGILFTVFAAATFGFPPQRPDLWWPFGVAGFVIGWMYHRLLAED